MVSSWLCIRMAGTCCCREEDLITRLRSPRFHRGGVNPRSLQLLGRAPRVASSQTISPVPVRIALVNARSIANKTFSLNHFFTSCGLNFLCLTETWLNAGELSSFLELLHLDCTYFNSPRTTGQGGGVATVFKKRSIYRQLLPAFYFSVESNIFELDRSHPILCAVIYRPPKYTRILFIHFQIFYLNYAVI